MSTPTTPADQLLYLLMTSAERTAQYAKLASRTFRDGFNGTRLVVPMSLDGELCLLFAPDGSGWAMPFGGWQPPLNARAIRLRFGTAQDSIRLTDLFVGHSQGVTSRTLRDLPVGRYEAAANYHDSMLRPHLPLASAAADPFPESEEWWSPTPAPVALAPTNLTLSDPGGFRKPDSFYRAAADAFAYLTIISPRPAADLAKHNAVPISTIHRWIKEARARGIAAAGERRRRGAA